MKYPLSFSIRIFLKKLNFLLTNLAELVPSTNLDYMYTLSLEYSRRIVLSMNQKGNHC
jgi:hypothetical protein